MQLADRRRPGGSRRWKSVRSILTHAFGSPFSESFALAKVLAPAPFGRCEPPRRRRSYCMVSANLFSARNGAWGGRVFAARKKSEPRYLGSYKKKRRGLGSAPLVRAFARALSRCYFLPFLAGAAAAARAGMGTVAMVCRMRLAILYGSPCEFGRRSSR